LKSISKVFFHISSAPQEQTDPQVIQGSIFCLTVVIFDI